jgi:hypothetical protein
MVGTKAAAAEKMIDQVGTLDEAIRRAGQLGRERREQSASRVAAEQLRAL